MVTPRLILHRQASSGLTIAFSVRTTDFKLSAEAEDPTAIATAPIVPIRKTTTPRTSPSKGFPDQLTAWDNGRAAAFFHPLLRWDLKLSFALFANRPAPNE
jgi:hypothetical protein